MCAWSGRTSAPPSSLLVSWPSTGFTDTVWPATSIWRAVRRPPRQERTRRGTSRRAQPSRRAAQVPRRGSRGCACVSTVRREVHDDLGTARSAAAPPHAFAREIRTPGLRMPAGSSAVFAAASAAANGSGRCRSYHGRWSRPTAWWWVIVPPLAMERVGRRRLDLVPLLRARRRRRPAAIHAEVRRRPVGVDVGEPAGEHPDGRRPQRAPAAAASSTACVQRGEPVPGARGLERLDDHRPSDASASRRYGMRRNDVAPGAGRAPAASSSALIGVAHAVRHVAAVVAGRARRPAPSTASTGWSADSKPRTSSAARRTACRR